VVRVPAENKSRTGEGCTNVRTDSLQPLSPLPPLPPPTSRPTPNPDPAATFTNIAAALTAPQLPLTLSTLHAHAAPTATFAGYPISQSRCGDPSDPATWPDSLPATLPKGFSLPLTITDPNEVERTDTPSGAHSRWTFRAATRTALYPFDCALTLTRDPANPDRKVEDSPWRVEDPPWRREAQDQPTDSPCWRLASFDLLRGAG
jgi:hypothetical protein